MVLDVDGVEVGAILVVAEVVFGVGEGERRMEEGRTCLVAFCLGGEEDWVVRVGLVEGDAVGEDERPRFFLLALLFLFLVLFFGVDMEFLVVRVVVRSMVSPSVCWWRFLLGGGVLLDKMWSLFHAHDAASRAFSLASYSGVLSFREFSSSWRASTHVC